jgi:hypothetical protein
MRTRIIFFLAFCLVDRGVDKVATTASSAHCNCLVSVNKHALH